MVELRLLGHNGPRFTHGDSLLCALFLHRTRFTHGNPFMLLKMRAHTISSLSLYLPRLQLHHNKSEKIGCTSNTVYLDEHFIIYSSIDWKGTNQKWFPFLLQKTVNNIWASVRRAPIKHGGASYYKNTTKFVLHTYIGPNKTINHYTKPLPRCRRRRQWRQHRCRCMMTLDHIKLRPLRSLMPRHHQQTIRYSLMLLRP
jgi:hypothetical protein